MHHIKPAQKIIFRSEYFDLQGCQVTTPQEKLDVVVQCILQNEDDSKKIYWMLSLLYALIEANTEFTLNIDSFKDSKWPGLSDDISDEICQLIEREPQKVLDLLFHPDSMFCGCNNNYWENSAHLVVHENSSEHRDPYAAKEGFYIVTGNY